MPDMLVKLYQLPDFHEDIKELSEREIKIRRPIPPEKHLVVEWVRENFGSKWASECSVAFSKKPVSCFVALRKKEILGFACYDTTCRDFFGPTGVLEKERGQSIGKFLLLKSLKAMREMGYAYAIIGGAGPVDYYKKVCGAEVIEGSEKGIYGDML
ncbi:GNAT family N-acetyltransferase [Natronospora cellulosivora (SeqCode)]